MPPYTAMRPLLPAALVLCLVAGVGDPARAQPAAPAADDRANATEAARLYDEGKRHFDIGEYAQAIASWKQAYLRSSAPLLLFNIAQAYRLSNNCAQANRFYVNYRRVEPHPKNAGELDKAMAKCAGVEPATGDPASEPATSAGDVATSGAPVPEPTPPVKPLAATAAGTPAGAPSNPPPERAVTQSSNRGAGLRTAGLVTGAVGAAAVVVGGIYAFQARRDSNTVSGAPIGTPYTGDVASTDRSGQTAASRAKGLIGVGAALVVAGGALWYVGHRQGAPQIDVAIGPGHTEVALSCAF